MLLSVIVPVHNSEKYLDQCVESIIGQVGFNDQWELILVENGSTDNSYMKCTQLKNKYRSCNIKLLKLKTGNVSLARNMGIRYAMGDYIHFVDSDDCLSSKMYSALKRETNCGYDLIITGIINKYTTTDTEMVEKSNKRIVSHSYKEISSFLLSLDSSKKVWALNVIWNKWFKRNIIVKYGIKFREDISLGEDFVFNCEYIKHVNSLMVLDEAYYYYIHRDKISLVNKFRTDVIYRRNIVYNSYCNLYDFYGILGKKKNEIDLIEGKLLFGSLYSIFSKDIPSNNSKKLLFIKNICESQHFRLAKEYLKQGNYYNKIALTLITNHKYKLLSFLLKIRMLIK